MEQQLIQETLESIKDYVPKLMGASEKIASAIQSHEGNWPDHLIAYLEGLSWLTTAIHGIQQVDQEILAEWDINALMPIMEQLASALQQQDLVSLADLLQYEMYPLLQSYDEDLRGMIH